jgi:hypothetical protein
MSVLSADRAEEMAATVGAINEELKKYALLGVAKWLEADAATRKNWRYSRYAPYASSDGNAPGW